jgi:O-methyltransferase
MKTAIFGAGQAGRMVRCWLPQENPAFCFIDNDSRLQGTVQDGLPVYSLSEALARKTEGIFIAVLNREAAESIAQQLQQAGFAGKVWTLDAYRAGQDLRLAALRLAAEEMEKKNVPGAVAELGVYRGDFAVEINALFPQRKLVLLDTFAGFTEEDMKKEEEVSGTRRFRDFRDTSAAAVRARLPHPEQAVFVEGHFPESVRDLPEESYAFVSLDPDLYAPMVAGLAYFWPRLSAGGEILIHDYRSLQFPGVGRAVEEFCRRKHLMVVPLMDLHGSCVLLKQGENA